MVSTIPSHTVDVFAATVLILATAIPTQAQPTQQPIGGYVVDVRGSVVPFSRNIELAEARLLTPLDTPGLGTGFEIGGHIYPLQWRFVTFGVGASFHSSRADQQPTEWSLDPDGPSLRKRFTALAPQLSFNFGGRNGWSYISGGISPSRLSLYPLNREAPTQQSSNTLNYGGGVRWFTSEHIAFSVDLRLYAISPIPGTSDEPASPRMTQMVLNIGASFR